MELFKDAPIMNRTTNETEWDKRPFGMMEEVFVKNNIIKITQSTVFCDLGNGKEVATNDCRTYEKLCQAEVTNAAKRELYG